jgi:dolichol-phosphate hexosyltransferase
MDADGSHDPKDIEKLIFPLQNGTDITIGSRFNTVEGRKTTTHVNLFGNYMLNLGILILTGRIVSDSQSGFRAYKSKVLKEIGINSMGFDVETELTMKPILLGYSLRDVPIFVRKRATGISRVNPLKDGIKMIKQLVELTFN